MAVASFKEKLGCESAREMPVFLKYQQAIEVYGSAFMKPQFLYANWLKAQMEEIGTASSRRMKESLLGPREISQRVKGTNLSRTGGIWILDQCNAPPVNGRQTQMLIIIDACSLMQVHVEWAFSLTGARVVHVLERLRKGGLVPQMLQVDNGPVFASNEVCVWALKHGVLLQFNPGRQPRHTSHASLDDSETDE